MKKYTTNSFKLYRANGQGKNYVFVDDLFLFELLGDDSKVVLDILRFIETKTVEDEEIIKHFKGKYSQSKVRKSIAFLKEMFVLTEVNETKKDVNYCIISAYENDILVNTLAESEENEAEINFNLTKIYNYDNYDIEVLKKQDLVIFDGDLIENSEKVIFLNSVLYNKDIPLAYFSLDRHSIIEIGPLCKKELQTPCLESFMKRKVSNLQQPGLFLNIISLDKKESRKPISSMTQKTAALMFKKELHSFFSERFSNLMGANFQLDTHTLEMSKSIILRAFNLSYEESPIVTPFN